MVMGKKQLYILCDMEGASQISPENHEAMHYGLELWQHQGRAYITSDLKAVCQAANEFGIDEIIVNDDHDSGYRQPNVLVEQLPRNVRVLHRPHMPGTPRKKTRGDLLGIVMVGQHAMAGSGGFAPHTIQSPPIGGVTVNDLPLGEIGIELALFMGVKFLAIIGEEAAVEEARALCPEVVGCPVKSLERNWFPTAEENAPRIKAKVLDALQRSDQAGSFHLPAPYHFSLRTSDGYCFDPEKSFAFRWLARFYFYRLYKGTMTAREAFWQTKKFVSGLNAIYMMKMFMSRQAQA
jgi:D-aminopeptidase